ncbi:MAG: hypothetical protein ACREIV_07900, partial [Planctomycetaceae bacterium]
LKEAGIPLDPKETAKAKSAELLAAGKLEQAAETIETRRSALDRDEQDLWALRLVARLVNENQLEDAFEFAVALEYPLLREEALEMLAARGTLLGHYWPIWKKAERRTRETPAFAPTEEISVLRGLVGGLVAMNDPPAQEETDAAE